MSEPAVSVVIPHYGAPELTQSLCRQLRRQRVDGGLEIVVVDDCSPVPFPGHAGVRTVRRETNGGFGSAVNTGARVASGELLLILNSDLKMSDGFVHDFIAAARPFQPGVFGPVVWTHGAVQPTTRTWPTPRAFMAERVELLARVRHSPLGERAVGIDPLPVTGDVQPCDWLAGMALLIPRSAFDAVGGFDESFFMYAEEVDLQRRLSEVGVTSYRVGSVEVEHLGGASSDPARTRQWLLDSRLRYAVKWGGARRIALGVVAAAGINVVSSSARRIVGRPTQPVRSFVRDLTELRHARVAVRGER